MDASTHMAEDAVERALNSSDGGPLAADAGLSRAAVGEGVFTAHDEQQWEQLLARDPASSFVYAVRTTGIYCRATCSSRRPLRANVLFFADAQAAHRAGFRACLRCRPDSQPDEALLIERLTRYLDQHRERRVSLAELGRVAGCAPGTVQRLFVRVLGLSPLAWVNGRRADAFRTLLSGPVNEAPKLVAPNLAAPKPGARKPGIRKPARVKVRITDAVYEAGFSSPSRAYGAAALGMEARRYRAHGAGERIGYTIAEATLPLDRDSSGRGKERARGATLGRLLVAATERGLCAVLLGLEDRELAAELSRRFPRAELVEDRSLAPNLEAVLGEISEHPSAYCLPLDLRGTAFQARVWASLREIPRGTTCSYTAVAVAIGAPRAVRAVARACAENPAALVVPCHRVVGSNGDLTGYRWGLDRKRTLLDLESSQAPESSPSGSRDEKGKS